MPVKDWVEWIGEDFTLFVIRDSRKGKLRSFSVVLMRDGLCISRYDTAHGRAHRDVLGAEKGWIKAIPCPDEMSYYEAFDFALRDLKKNHEKYHRFFLQN